MKTLKSDRTLRITRDRYEDLRIPEDLRALKEPIESLIEIVVKNERSIEYRPFIDIRLRIYSRFTLLDP